MNCKDRILSALHHVEMSPQELADALFVTRATVKVYLRELFREGFLYRKFFHNTKTNRPDYKYCCVEFPAPQRVISLDPEKAWVAQTLVGEWDTKQVRFRKGDAA